MTARSQPGPAADAPSSRAGHLAVVAAPVELDHATAAWLLRWCEAWLHRLDVGEADLAHLLIDVSHTRRAAPSGLALLEQARTEAGRRGVGIHLVGVGVLLAASSLQVRRCLGRWSAFPTWRRRAQHWSSPDSRPISPRGSIRTRSCSYPPCRIAVADLSGRTAAGRHPSAGHWCPAGGHGVGRQSRSSRRTAGAAWVTCSARVTATWSCSRFGRRTRELAVSRNRPPLLSRPAGNSMTSIVGRPSRGTSTT